MKAYVFDATFVVMADSEERAREEFKNVSRRDIESLANGALIKDVLIIQKKEGRC